MKQIVRALLAVLLLAGIADAQAINSRGGNRIWIPAQSFHATSAGADAGKISLDATVPVFTEISSFGVAGWAMTTADVVSTYMVFPADLINKKFPLAVRLWWTSTSGTDDGGIDWQFGMEEKVLSAETAFEAAAAASLADKITFDEDTVKVQYGINSTNWDTISKTALRPYHQDTMVEISVELGSLTVATGTQSSADETIFMGIELCSPPADFKADSFYVSGSTAHVTTPGITLGQR